MNSEQDRELRKQLLDAMHGNQAHLDFDDSLIGLSAELSGMKPEGSPHTAWQLLEHMRIAQHDILEFSRNPQYQSPKWPEGYWPQTDAAPDQRAWELCISQIREDAKAMEDLISDPKQDLFKPIAGGSGQTLLREALVVAAHNSYHLGQLVFLKKVLVN